MADHVLKYTGNEVDALFDKINNLEDSTSALALLDGVTENVQAQLNRRALKAELPTSISELTNDSGFITNTANNLTNYYLKTESYTREEVNNLIGALTSLNMEVVSELPTDNISSTTIYLKGNETMGENDYEEWIYVNDNWEIIGRTEIDLTGVALLSDIPTKVSQLSNDSNFITANADNLTNYYKKSEVNDLVNSADLSAYATKEYVAEQINAKEYTFHMFYDAENYNDETITTNLLPTLNAMYQDYLAGKKPILVFVSDATFGMSAETGMYMINAAETDTAVVEFEQLNPSISWENTGSYTELDNCIYRIRGFLTDGVITSADWKTTGFSDGGQGYLAVGTYYSKPFMPDSDYQPATKKYVDSKANIVEINLYEESMMNKTYSAEEVATEFEKAFILPLNENDATDPDSPQYKCTAYFLYDSNTGARLPLQEMSATRWTGEETEYNFSSWSFKFAGVIKEYSETAGIWQPILKTITVKIKYDKSKYLYMTEEIALAQHTFTSDYAPTFANDVTTKKYVDEAITTAINEQLTATY